MPKYTTLALAFLLFTAAGPLAAQQQQDNGTGTQRVVPPALVSGQGGTLAFSSELARTNYVRGGITVTSTFDDNVLNTNTGQTSDIGYSVVPHIALDQSLGRLAWTTDYAGGFTAYQRVTGDNQASHSFGLKGQYRLSPHVTLRLTDRFTDTTNFFNQPGSLLTPSPGSVLQNPNSNFVTPLQRSIGNFLNAGADYQVGAGTVIGGSGTFYYTRYKNVADNQPSTSNLLNTHSDQAQGFYTHRISNKNWVGVEYDFQRLTFGPGNNETIVHSVHYFHTINLQPNMTLSLFAGPEYSQTGATTISTQVELPYIMVLATSNNQNMWSTSGGVTYTWQGKRTSTVAEFVRRVSDGGGYLGAVNVTSVNGSLRRQLTRSFGVTFGGAYAANTALDNGGTPGVPDSSINYWTASAGVERRLTNGLVLSFGYARQDQQQSGGTQIPTAANHNRGWISLAYNFTRPWGR
jgi:hypothetical protein